MFWKQENLIVLYKLYRQNYLSHAFTLDQSSKNMMMHKPKCMLWPSLIRKHRGINIWPAQKTTPITQYELALYQLRGEHYDERIDCKASCCWGCKDDHVEARADGGSVCCSCLNKLTILLAVCSEARSFPEQRTCTQRNFNTTVLEKYDAHINCHFPSSPNVGDQRGYNGTKWKCFRKI